ncbi:copper homeostasis protein CutC [Caproiciproducens sp.]|uniref:copper homeostasis protein CutC n=1 Tax=Caproiciproducens sp. TaxID=1954376 RepID=UPI00289C0F3B|nr:copper homeostasis protein CutC [Caproiciproducens sp.]
MKDYILECCVDSVESAVAAQAGGANRLELCANLVIGGTTPDINLFLAVREKVSIKINVLIRPRFGDFCYTGEEFGIIKKDVEMFRKYGADGVVIGVLREDGSLDIARMKELMDAAGNMSVTLHRAFDVSCDPFQTLKDAEDLHIGTILTSGQKNTCYECRELLGQLVEKTAGKVDILVGSGVNSAQIAELAAVTKAKSFHLSGKVNVESVMTYRKEDVSMGLPLMSEYTIFRTDAGEIAKVRDILQRL